MDAAGRPGDRPAPRRRPVVLDGDGLPSVPGHRRRAWEGLSWSERRAVLRAARQGRSHPDPAIAQAARDWARALVAPRTRPRRLGDILSSLLEDPFAGTLGHLSAERRAARRILRVNAAAGPEPPAGPRPAR